MAGSPYGKIEEHVDHLTLMNAAVRCIGIEFYDIVTARNTRLQILRLCAQSTCANNRHLSRARTVLTNLNSSLTTVPYTVPMPRGFTLIQISILLTAASLAMVATMPGTQLSLNTKSATANKMNAILTAMRQYEAANAMLPCPADASQPIGSATYGVAAANPGGATNCTGGSPAANYVDATNHVAIGMVPVRALGLSNDYALDAYGRAITYAVDTNATVCFQGTLPGKITVTDNGTASNSVIALVSHGANGHGAWIARTGATGTAVRLNTGSSDTDELTNAHVDGSFNPTAILTNFVKGPPTATFDDIVVYKNPLWNLGTEPLVATSGQYTVTTPANGAYVTGNTLSFTATFPAAVTVTGTPRLVITLPSGTVYANYASGSGTPTLTFNYTVLSGCSAPSGMTVMNSPIDLNGGTINATSNLICKNFSPPNVTGLLVNPPYILIGDTSNNKVRKVTVASGFISTVAGTGGAGSSGDGAAATAATLSAPGGVALDASGNIYIADYTNNEIRKVTISTGKISTIVDTGGHAGYCCDGGAATSGEVKTPQGVAVDSSGNIYIADTGNHVIRKVTISTGKISTIAGTGSANFGGDGGLATAGSVTFNTPSGVAVDGSGNFYIADTLNNRIRKVTISTGFISTVVGTGSSGSTGDGAAATSAKLNGPQGVAVDGSGNIYIADTGNNKIRKVTISTGFISTIAGTGTAGSTGDGAAATSAKLSAPKGVGLDTSGNIYVADTSNNKIREITIATGFISTVAGNGTAGSTGDGAAATSAEVNAPIGVAVSQ
jgi:sugar lactone lactonase YvrE